MQRESFGGAELVNGECLEFMRTLADSSVDAIITDPPYFKVKGEAWDNQWQKPAEFLAWVSELLVEFERILKPNGSLYFFASPQMAARVEVAIRERFNVLNHISWIKRNAKGQRVSWGNKASKESLRAFFPETEKVIFAEHYNSDNIAKGEAGYLAKCDELRGFVFEPLRAYLVAERERAGLTREDVRQFFASKLGTKGKVSGHYYDRSQWSLPTREHYEWLRECHNARGGEYLRKDYEELRKDYEELRRPFAVSANDQWSDVWEFAPVAAYPGKHPCEKPLPLLLHMLNASTRPGALVFDPFAGSGSMAHACLDTGRRFIGTELCPDNYAKACRRLESVAGGQIFG